MTRKRKRLQLAKETVRSLETAELSRVAGGRRSDEPGAYCAPTKYDTCAGETCDGAMTCTCPLLNFDVFGTANCVIKGR